WIAPGASSLLCAETVEPLPDILVGAPAGPLRVGGRLGLEEVSVFLAGQQRLEPRQRVLAGGRLSQTQLPQPPLADEADVGLDVLRGHALDRTHVEGLVDEAVLLTDDSGVDVADVVL